MAINVVFPILIPLEENLHNATRLLSGSGEGPLEFTQPHYCAVLREDAQLAAAVLNVTAVHKRGAPVRYSITGGNRDGLFTIDQHTGLITLAATLDYEVYDKHELVVSGEGGGSTVHTIVQVRVADVNDNPPAFIKQNPQVTVIEEDDRHLPTTLLKVEARDKDDLDYQGLLYTVRGDGVDGFKPSEAYFTINSLTGELIQQRALDRDPPRGKAVWKVRVQVRDGQALWSRPRDKRRSHWDASLSPKNNSPTSDGRKRMLSYARGINNKRRRKERDNDSEWERNVGKRREEGDRHVIRRSKTRDTIYQDTNHLQEKRHLEQKTLLSRRHRGNEITVTENSLFSRITTNGETRVHTTDNEDIQNEPTEKEKLLSLHKTPKAPFSDRAGDDQIIRPDKFSLVNKGLADAHIRTIDPSKNKGPKDPFSFQEGSKSSFRDDDEKRSEMDYIIHGAKYPEMFKKKTRSTTEEKRFLLLEHKGSKSISRETSAASKNSRLGDAEGILAGARNLSNPPDFHANTSKTYTSKIKKKHYANVRKASQYSSSPLEKESRLKRTAEFTPFGEEYEFGSFGMDGGCEEDDFFGGKSKNITADPSDPWANTDLSAYGSGGRMGRVHVVETIVTLFVKDINDNPPVFPNATMFGEVQENGPIDLSVAVVSAWDADDADEGSNARITYSIEKNVVHERTGEAIFSVHPKTGLVTTAVCCLDRETTPEYHIQVVATDGGGLKGTGTVIVRLADVNDNSPRIAKKMWEVQIDETWGAGPPDNSTLLEISVHDRDTANYFYYRVVEDSGWGWEHFGIKSVRSAGHLYARQTLDYEDDTHRRGFKFMIQVTDRGRGGWVDPRHLDSAWIKVSLNDLNDNPPIFHRPHAHVTVKEDAPIGTLLATLPAHDPDMGGKQEVEYRVVGGWGALTVDKGGGVSLWRSLDREASDGAIGVAKVIAVDSGQPPLTSTATLTITVTDVNDCPPVLLPPTVFHVTEGSPATKVGVLTATDHDVWALGHGPPFNLTLAPSNPPHIKAHIDIKFDPHLDSGRGGAEVWTKDSIDREEHRELSVGVLLRDAGGLADTQTIRVVLDDLNDNPMKPAAKTVYLWKTQSGSSDAPLGRVYVDDPDDWDIGDKEFEWVGQPHPLFSLNRKDGTIFASSQVREGRYELQFAVSDRFWGQRGVSANVTVAVRLLTQDAISHSTPITLTSTTPEQLTAGWSPMKGGGGLGKLMEGVKMVAGETAHSVEVVSIYDNAEKNSSPYLPKPFTSVTENAPSTTSSVTSEDSQRIEPYPATHSVCVWVSVKEKGGRFMDPVKLNGILNLHSSKLEKATNLTILVENPSTITNQGRGGGVGGGGGEGSQFEETPHSLDAPSTSHVDPLNPSSAASRASTTLPLQVVDTNTTSLVTPRLTRTAFCSGQEPETCTPNSCLNDGRCIRTLNGNRCVCPTGGWGSQCKILSRTFRGSGFAWVRPLPSCLPTMISFRLLTLHRDALLLYAGPLIHHSRTSHSPPTPLLALQITNGHAQMVVEGGDTPLKLEVSTAVNDGNWHYIHARLDFWGASLMIDLCGQGWEDETIQDDSHCIARKSWSHPKDAELWFNSAPIQLGGLAHSPPRPLDHGWTESPISRPLEGCLSHLTINGQLMDLGEPALSQGSVAGCTPQERACSPGLGACGVRGACVGGLNQPECQCEPGWTGPSCSTPTMPASLGSRSYMRVALSFTPASRVMSVQLRVRTRGMRTGLLLHMASEDSQNDFTLKLQAGIACASVTSAKWASQVACVEGRLVGDGMWHTISAERYGNNLLVSIDDADGWRHNHSLPSLLHYQSDEGNRSKEIDDYRGPPLPLEIDKNEGVMVGGLPEFVGVKLITVYDDLKDTCLDDLRISGKQMPLAPTLNGTTWGQVTTFEGVESGCNATNACPNITCAPPLSCINNWGRPTCSCGQGRQLIGRTCEDVDECLWRPCLHGGSCYNMRPGFMCVCGPGHQGEHCQWTNHNNSAHPLAGPAAIAAVTLSLLLLVVVGVILSWRLRRHWASRALGAEEANAERDSRLNSEEATIIEVKGGTEEGGGKIGTMKTEPTQELLLESLKLPHIQPALQTKGEKNSNTSTISRRPSKSSLLAAAAVLEGRAVIGGEANMAKDDLRAYAYEGDGSSAGSLTSALSGLRVEQSEEGSIIPLVPAFLDVMDLLKNLPEASRKPSLVHKENGESPTPPPKIISESLPVNKPVGETISNITSNKGKMPNVLSTFSGSPAPSSQSKLKTGGGEEEISTIC